MKKLISLAAVVAVSLGQVATAQALEAGIGVAAFEHTEIENNDLGSSFQFEDRLGAGLRFAGGHEIGIRAIHYSNAGLKNPNNGIESYAVHYRASF